MKNLVIGIGLLSFSVLSIPNVLAYRGDVNVQGPNYSAERHEKMIQAFANRDYTSWFNLMSQNSRRGRVLDVITADNFSTFAQAHDLAMAGDKEGFEAIRSKLGLGLRNRQGREYKRGNGQGRGRRLCKTQ